MKNHTEKSAGVFPTRNQALALALLTAGVETAPPHVTNLYTTTKLKELRMSASEAEKKGVPGLLTYYFRTSERLQSMLAAWDAQKESIRSGEAAELEISDEDFMRAAAMLAHNREGFRGLWRQCRALVKIPDDDGKGFRIISTNASPELRARMGFSK